jgi:hypothetical protein
MTMESNISSFAKLSEPDRMIFIARLHHAIWYDEKLYKRLEYFMNHLEKKLPEATYFPEITEEL